MTLYFFFFILLSMFYKQFSFILLFENSAKKTRILHELPKETWTFEVAKKNTKLSLALKLINNVFIELPI